MNSFFIVFVHHQDTPGPPTAYRANDGNVVVYDSYPEAEAVAGEPDAERRRTLARLRRELRRIAARDHFDLDDAERASRALERLGRRTVGA